jgi:hypothetical protein
MLNGGVRLQQRNVSCRKAGENWKQHQALIVSCQEILRERGKAKPINFPSGTESVFVLEYIRLTMW